MLLSDREVFMALGQKKRIEVVLSVSAVWVIMAGNFLSV
jgi:hypothetical protein